MSKPMVTKHAEEQTGIHLMMAGIASIFGALLILATFVMAWELWMAPLIAAGIFALWGLHIGRTASDHTYEYVCAGVMSVEFFYFGAHGDWLYDTAVIVCVMLFMLAFLDKTRLLYLVYLMYVLLLLYHILFLRTIGPGMGAENLVRLGLGLAGTGGAMLLSNTVIKRRREERKELSEMAGMFEDAKRRNAEFLSKVSHVLRTPINMVTGISEVALSQETVSQLWDSIRSIQMAGRRLAAQIGDILDYTEIVGNTLVVTKEEYMPSSLVNDVIAAAVTQNGEKKLELVFDLSPQLPAILIGDAEKISRVLRILIQNAIQYTEKGAVYLYIGFRQESYGLNLDITVSDTGIGMTPAQIARVYEDLYLGDDGHRHYLGGLGLGIPIARGLLHAMEGFIHYRSKENHGTQIHISIPQGVADAAPGMTLSDPKQICVACYFKQDKYDCGEVRQYYDALILHLAEGLGIQAYRAYHFVDLEKLLNSYCLTHLFLSKEEYKENISYFEELGKSICVALIAEKEFSLEEGSRLVLIHKPFFALPIVNLLNGVTYGKDMWENVITEREFSCEGMRVLVVDDEEMNLVVARGILGSYGMRVDTCQSGALAVERCAGTIYDMIFLDHMMPGMDGVETLKRIRGMKEGNNQNLPIIALTANAISGAREMFKREGFTEFVPKPIERSVLERVLRRVLPKISRESREGMPEGSGFMNGAGGITPGDGNAPIGRPEETLDGGTNSAFGSKENSRDTGEAGYGQDITLPSQDLQGVLERLRQFGINVEMGLGYCGGEEEFYLEMLQMYCDQNEAKREEMAGLCQKGDWENYVIKAHALKSTSLTIGAEELSAQAKALELAGKEGDTAFVLENNEKMLQSYEATCKYIMENVSMKNRGLQFTLMTEDSAN